MKKIFVSIVSHEHYTYISTNTELININNLDGVQVVIKDNVGEAHLKTYCEKVGFHYIDNPTSIGFGANNNNVFKYCLDLGMKNSDWFMVINPDVEIDIKNFLKISNRLFSENEELLAINLYKDKDYMISENSLRYYPKWRDLSSLLLGHSFTKTYDKNELSNGAYVEWASGAFLIFKVELYKNLNGFDKKYHMYFEDVDICHRAHRVFKKSVIYLKDVKAIHSGAYQNRNLFSKHFRWYLKSLFTFLISK